MVLLKTKGKLWNGTARQLNKVMPVRKLIWVYATKMAMVWNKTKGKRLNGTARQQSRVMFGRKLIWVIVTKMA